MSNINYREYNDFNKEAIKKVDNNTSSLGWTDDYIAASLSTPLNADNLNAMLNMLIYIRNVIGKTDDFITDINGTAVNIPDIDIDKYDKSNPSERLDKSIATYLKEAFTAIVGNSSSGEGQINASIKQTLSGLKTYIESLDSKHNAETSKWINSINQEDGKIISIGTSQPKASDIAYNKDSDGTNLESDKTVDDALDTLDTTIGDLATVKFDGVRVEKLDTLIAIIQRVIDDRIAVDNELSTQLNSEISRATSKENELEAAISNEKAARISEDTVLQSNITTEQNRAEEVEKTLESNINTEIANRVAAIEQEAAARDDAIQTAIKGLESDWEYSNASEIISKIDIKEGKLKTIETTPIKIDISQVTGLSEAIENAHNNVYTTDSIDNLKETYKEGDIAIVSNLIFDNINDDSKDITQKTAYIYKDGEWQALQGNYNAKNVYFNKNIILAGDYTQVGNLKKDISGTLNLESAGKNLYEVMQSIFTKEIKPGDTGYAIDLPSASISVSGSSGIVEVGNTFTLPTATLKITDVGSYPFEPKATGITFAIDNVSLSQYIDDDNIITVKNNAVLGANDSISLKTTGTDNTYGDSDVSFTFTGTAAYSASTVTPKSNLGNEYADKKISAGSCTISSQTAKFKGYRKWFYGGDTKTDFASDTIRDLTNSTAAVSGQTFELKAASYSGCSRIVIAIPANGGKILKEVLLKSSSNADITSEFKKINTAENVINVAGHNSYTPISYNVWEYKPASLDSTEVYTITIG